VRILVVDDEFVSLSKLTLLLSPYGECKAATSGEQALTMVKAAHEEGRPYRLITMDIDMPGMSGQEAVAAIRKLELARGIVTAADEVKILMVTAMTDGRNIMASFRTGCEGYITKPFTKESLGKALAPFLEQIGTP